MTDKLRFYSDSGHGWLAVPVRMLANSGVLRQMSRYSYHDAQTAIAYLEEDCDAPLFLREMGIDIAMVESAHMDGYCFIRQLGRLDAGRLADSLGVE